MKNLGSATFVLELCGNLLVLRNRLYLRIYKEKNLGAWNMVSAVYSQIVKNDIILL